MTSRLTPAAPLAAATITVLSFGWTVGIQPAPAHELEPEAVSASEAKRIVRRYLTEKGYSRKIGPGGASVEQVQLDGQTWIVRVALRGASATSIQRRNIYVDSLSGLVRVQDGRRPAEAAIAKR